MPGKIGQPLNATARTVSAGAVGGLVAGTVLSALLAGMAAAADEPSELVQLKRRSVGRVGSVPNSDRGEEVASHAGHLALSAASGALFALVKPKRASPVLAGSVFGAAFYALAYGVVGPALRASPKLTDDTPSSIVRHGLFHLVFGITTAVVADEAAKRI